jgi:hypothetical protein
MKAPVWKMERRKLTDLRPFEQNPRRIMEKPLADLTRSIAKFGLAEPLVIQPDGLLIGGHARYQVLLAQGVAEADCYAPDRALSQKDMIELNIRLNKNVAGEFDFDALAGLDGIEVVDLVAFGFEEHELGMFSADGIDNPALKDGDRAPFRQMTFTVHDEQFEEVEAAMKKAKADGGGESAVNENSNGNALAWVCGKFNRG